MGNGLVTSLKHHRLGLPASDPRLKEPRRQPAAVKSDPAEARAACREMEALFLNYLLQEMRATVDKSGLLSGGRAEEIYTTLLDEHVSRELSRSGGVGLAQVIYRQINHIGSADRHSGDGCSPDSNPHRSMPSNPLTPISTKDSGSPGR